MEEELRQAGLTRNEVKVYINLLKVEQILASELAKKIGLDRSVTYNVLNNLIEKGLVNYVIKAGKKFFSATNPEILLESLKEKEDFIKSIIPELKKIQKFPEVKRKIETYEGKEGLKSFAIDLLKSEKFYILNATGKIFEILKYSFPRFAKEISKKKVKVIAIEEAKKTELINLKIKIKFLPEEFSNYATTFIYGDKVALQIITEKPLIIIIENKTIADGYRKIFEFIWKFCK